eukprot:546495_1
MSENLTNVIIHFNGQHYPWTQYQQPAKLNALNSFVVEQWKIKNDTFELEYEDEDNIRQVIDDDDELQEAFELVEDTGELHIYVTAEESQIHYDFKMFENKSTDCDNDFLCRCTKRLVTAMKYYQSLDMTDTDDQQQLMEFYHEKYNHILDDFAHLLTKHHETLDTMYDYAVNDIGLDKCTAKKCLAQRRHNRDRDNEYKKEKKTNDEDTPDKDFLFVRDTMDGVHCYILHQYDFGF